MDTEITDHKIEKSLGPSGVFAGYSLAVFGIIGLYFSLAAVILVISGLFLALTYEGTRIDYKLRRIKNYTCLAGVFRAGKWYSIDDFTKFRIYKSNRTYKTYSRANIPQNLKVTDIRLSLLNNSGTLKITVNRFDTFEAARNEMSDLIRKLQIRNLEEWI